MFKHTAPTRKLFKYRIRLLYFREINITCVSSTRKKPPNNMKIKAHPININITEHQTYMKTKQETETDQATAKK